MGVESWMTVKDGYCGITGKVQVLGQCLDGQLASFVDLLCTHGSTECDGMLGGGDDVSHGPIVTIIVLGNCWE